MLNLKSENVPHEETVIKNYSSVGVSELQLRYNRCHDHYSVSCYLSDDTKFSLSLSLSALLHPVALSSQRPPQDLRSRSFKPHLIQFLNHFKIIRQWPLFSKTYSQQLLI